MKASKNNTCIFNLIPVEIKNTNKTLVVLLKAHFFKKKPNVYRRFPFLLMQ